MTLPWAPVTSVTFFVGPNGVNWEGVACRARHDFYPESFMIRGVLSPDLTGVG